MERKSFFYIISGVPDLFQEVKNIYSFKEGMLEKRVKVNEVEDYLSSSSKKLLNLAIQLFNGGNEQNILSTFSSLDDKNFRLAINSIKIRFRKIEI